MTYTLESRQTIALEKIATNVELLRLAVQEKFEREEKLLDMRVVQ